MKRCNYLVAVLIFASLLIPFATASAGNYQNFNVAIYVTRDTVRRWADAKVLQADFDAMTQQVKFDKVYLEFATARQINDENTLDSIKQFFVSKNVTVSGATALNGGGAQGRDPRNASLSYADPADRDYVKRVAEAGAKHFDEMILDDWFFNASKTPADIEAKGDKSWTRYRLDAMDDAAEKLLLKPGKAINPKFRIIIKYPNWYEHYQAVGYDLEKEPKLFDAIYTGVETRDPIATEQHLQQYLSYNLGRYLENVKPGGNAGSWVDQLQTQYIDRYAEEVWDMALAKPKEITLWQWSGALSPIKIGDRPWEKSATSFDYQKMADSYHGSGQPMTGHVASFAMSQIDAIAGKLGKPTGIAGYRPTHSIGEEFLYDYLGMIGIPIDLRPDFPTDADNCLLTEAAKNDPDVVAKIKAQLVAGKNVTITSGLLRALGSKGLADITELEYTDQKVSIDRFQARGGDPVAGDPRLADPIRIPIIHFLTNQSWSQVSGLDATAPQNGYPLVISDIYSKGKFCVLTIPDNPADLYRLPPTVLGAIKSQVMGTFPIRLLDAPGQVAIFAYDNNSFVVESFRPEECSVAVSFAGRTNQLSDLVSGDKVAVDAPATRPRGRRGGAPSDSRFTIKLPPHSFRAFSTGNE